MVRRGVVDFVDFVVADADADADAAADSIGATMVDVAVGACAVADGASTTTDTAVGVAFVVFRDSDEKNKIAAAAKATRPIAPTTYPAGLRRTTPALADKPVSSVFAIDAPELDAGDGKDKLDEPDAFAANGGSVLGRMPALSSVPRIRNADSFAAGEPKGANAVAKSPMFAQRSAGLIRMQR